MASIDIDLFKTINDAYGHDAGDTVLRHFACVCTERMRTQDCLGRMGGEEFLLLLPETKIEDALDLINVIRQDFPAALLAEEGIDLAYTFSAGLTEALPGETRSSILRRADRALYTAKTEGRNRTKIGQEFAKRN